MKTCCQFASDLRSFSIDESTLAVSVFGVCRDNDRPVRSGVTKCASIVGTVDRSVTRKN